MKLAECLDEVVRGIGDGWRGYPVLGATRSGIAPAKEPVGKQPGRYKLVSPGTIFYNPMRILLGSIAMVDDGEPAGITSPDYVVLRPKDGMVHHRWLYYWLRSAEGAALIKSLTRGAVRERLLFRRLAKGEINPPSYFAQLRFAEEIRLVVRARAAAEACLEAATALEKAVFREAFEGLVPLSAGTSGVRPPRGWAWKRLTSMARLESGHTPSRNRPDWWGGEIRWIALPDIRELDGQIAHETRERTNPEGIAHSAARVLPANTVVLSRTASVGFVTILGREMATSQDFVNWVCGADLYARFLMHLLRASRDYFRSLASGAVHKTVYMPTVESLEVCVPPLDEQTRIARSLDQKLGFRKEIVRSCSAEIRAIDSLPATLLRRAFRGEL